MASKAPVTVSIVPSTIRIREKVNERRKTPYLRDGDFPDEGTFATYIEEFLEQYRRTTSISSDSFSGLHIANSQSSGNRISGTVESGKFGFESCLVDIDDVNKTKKREKTDCELIPFFFLFEFKPGESTVILLTEQYGIYNPKRGLVSCLQEFTLSKLPNCIVETATIVDPDYIRDSLDKNIKALRFFWHSVPKDIADTIDREDTEIKENGKMEVVVKPKRGFFFSKPEWLKLGNKLTSGLTIADVVSDEMKIDVQIEGKTKTINVEKLSCFKTAFDVTENVQYAPNAHPTHDSMLSESKVILKMAKKVLKWRD